VDLKTGKLLLRVMKTGAPLSVRLGPPAVEALPALPDQGEYFFLNRESKLVTAIGVARKTISRVLAGAAVRGHPDRPGHILRLASLEGRRAAHRAIASRAH
jgi:hypothetical protein